MEFFVMALALNEAEGVATIHEPPENLPFKSFRFHKGKPLKQLVKEPLKFHFSEDHPRGEKLVDLQHNIRGLFIVSEKLAGILDGHANIGFIPAEIFDHAGELASDTHCIANFLDVCDYVGHEKSEYVTDSFDEDGFFSTNKLVFDDARIDPAIEVFRLKQSPRTVVLSGALVQKIEHTDVQGPLLVPIESFDNTCYLGC